MLQNEAHARIRINQLRTEAGWMFFDNEEGKANILLENHITISQKEIDAWGNDSEKALYSSPYMLMNNKEYTKHYFNEGERVCSKIGGGFGMVHDPTQNPVEPIKFDYKQIPKDLWEMTGRGLQCVEFDPENAKIEPDLPPAYNMENRTETDQFFYHSDHLGSSSFITNINGAAIQHLQYLPFGETFVDQRHESPYNTPYRFSGKEKDDETQYSYFGARYYDSDLSVWLSVDPMAGKYPSMSAFMYCGGNPVILVDPDGRDIVVTGDQKEDAKNQLQKSAGKKITIKMDENGNLSYEKNTDKKLSGNSKKIAKIIDDHSIIVNLKTTDKNRTSDNRLLVGGAFMGNVVKKNENGIVISVSAFQEVNTNTLGKCDDFTGNSGEMILHEVTEAYEGALISKRSGISSPPAIANTDNGTVYNDAHNRATYQSPIVRIFYDILGNETIDPKLFYRVTWSVVDSFGNRKVIQTEP